MKSNLFLTIRKIRRLSIVEELGAKVVIAGPATDTGQKVHNLIVATQQIDPRAEVLVFVDTDARPDSDWLRKLVAPLADEKLGASTGYRWFIPERGGLASRLRGVWNASVASALGADTTKNFCWGGSTAIRRSTFEELRVVDHWRGTVSDDFTITRVLKEAKRADSLHAVVASCLRSAIVIGENYLSSPRGRSRSRASTRRICGCRCCSVQRCLRLLFSVDSRC